MVDVIYEEVIKLSSLKDTENIEKYYIGEDINDIDRVNFILKKGFQIQKESLIKNIPKFLQDKCIIENIISKSIEYLEIWEDSLLILFANRIPIIFKDNYPKTIISNLADVINPLIFAIMKIIQSDDKKIIEPYLVALNEIVDFYGNNGKLKIDTKIIETATNLGMYGKTIVQRRYSVYFCSCLFQINNTVNNDLRNRFMVLASDTERIVRLELSYHIRFLIRDSDENYIKKNLLKILEVYLNDDDINIIVSIAISIFNVYEKITEDSFLTVFTNKVNWLFELDIIPSQQIKLFRSLISETQNYLYISSPFLKAVKSFLKKHHVKIDNRFILEDAHLIGSFLSYHREDNLMDTFVYSLKKFIFGDNSYENNDNDISDEEDCGSLSKDKKEIVFLFYENLEKLLKYTPAYLQSKCIAPFIFKFFYENDQEYLKEKMVIILNKLDLIFKNIDSGDFFRDFVTYFQKFDYFLSTETLNWRIITNFLRSITNCEKLFFNEDFVNKTLFKFTLKYLNNENLQIKTEAIKLLAKTLRFSNKTQSEEILKYIENEVLISKNTFIRRLFFIFFEESLKIFSISFLKEKKIINLLTNLMEDNINLANKALSLVPKFYILIEDDPSVIEKINNGVKFIKTYYRDNYTSENLRSYEFEIERLTKRLDRIEKEKILENDREKCYRERQYYHKDTMNITTIKTEKDEDYFMKKILIKKNHSKKLPSFSESYLKQSISKIINSTNSSSVDLLANKTTNLRSIKNISAKQKILSVASNKNCNAHSMNSPSKYRENNFVKYLKNSMNSGENTSNSEGNSKFLFDKSIDCKNKNGSSYSAIKDGAKFLANPPTKILEASSKIITKNVKITLTKGKK